MVHGDVRDEHNDRICNVSLVHLPSWWKRKNCVDVVNVPLREYKRRALKDGSGVDWERINNDAE